MASTDLARDEDTKEAEAKDEVEIEGEEGVYKMPSCRLRPLSIRRQGV